MYDYRVPDVLTDRSGFAQPYHTPWLLLLDALNQPAVIITVVLVALSLLFNNYGLASALEEAASSLGSHLWEAFVYVTPSPLVHAVDNRLHPAEALKQMVGTQPSSHASKSAAMRRILGLERGGRGMMASVFQARNRALSMTGSALGLKVDSERPAGLGNRDNSCFQNSILQGLASLETLPEYLSTCLRHADSEGDDAGKVVTQTLQTLLTDLTNASNNGRTLWTPNKLRFMSTWTQQDAQEYYSKILDDIDKGAAKALKATTKHTGFESDIGKDDAAASQHSDDSGYQSLNGSSKASEAISFRNPLEGLLAQRVSCVQCGHSEGLSMIPFNCLTLSLGLRGQHDLYERLDSYSTVEAIEGVECAKCTLLKVQRLLTKLVEQMREKGVMEEQLAEPLRRLEAVELSLEEDHFDDKTLAEDCKISSQSKVTTTKTKQIVIARPPQSLAIHVNRSVFDPSTFDMIKNSAPVDFPMTLDLGPWCLGSASSANVSASVEGGTANDAEGEYSEEQWVENPTKSMIAGDMRPSKLSGPIYELRAVVTHYGRHENGHYICYRKHPRHSPPRSRRSSTATLAGDGETEDVVEPELGRKAESNDAGSVDDSAASDSKEMDWWRLSDHNVSKVNEETLANLSSGVFMLFYDCVDPNMVPQDSSEAARSANSHPAEATGVAAGVPQPAEAGPSPSDLEKRMQAITVASNQEAPTTDSVSGETQPAPESMH